jgi:hypothetical protein
VPAEIHWARLHGRKHLGFYGNNSEIWDLFHNLSSIAHQFTAQPLIRKENGRIIADRGKTAWNFVEPGKSGGGQDASGQQLTRVESSADAASGTACGGEVGWSGNPKPIEK